MGDMGNKVVLVKQVNLLDCTVLIAGTVIGSGIFISPKGILANTGSVGWSMLVWLTCGIFSCIGALCYAELASSIPESGGDYSYLRHSFGRWISFLRVWTSLLAIRTGGFVVVSRVAADSIIESLGNPCFNNTTSSSLLAALFLACIIYINCSSVNLSRKIHVIFTAAKTLGLITIIVTGLWTLFQAFNTGNTESFENGFDLKTVTWTHLPKAFYSGLFAFSGWQFLPQITEEIIDPERNIPVSILISSFAVTVLYILTNIAYFSVLSPSELLASESVAVTFGQRILGPIWWILPIFVTLSCIGSVNGGIFGTARMFFVASREGQLPSILGMVQIHRRTPLAAAACVLPICLVMLTTDDVYVIINYLSFSRWLFMALTVITVPYFRWKYPDLHRPFKVPVLLAVLFALCAVFMVVSSVVSAFREFAFGLLITVAGIPIYAVFVVWETKPVFFLRVMKNLTIYMQKILLVVPQEEKTFVKNF
ncbi:Cystine/glutamate transporter [Holothuria leucospilota]|uniref:Cystine/glutamate transporter n=1 Tax=Holothuria leucospilota TaxID=206669 RepID=A0A9Q1CCA6_HOLLE|nr:Cystine/glutamate transporter [Holothuria leucospilota]